MNQQLLNINTVINSGQIVNSKQEADENNNPLKLDMITSLVNNANSSTNYKIVRYLGKGIQGNLYLALDAKGNRVICKEIEFDNESLKTQMQKKQLEFELNILKYLSNNSVAREHINPCLDYKIHSNLVYTLFPVFKGYSLSYYGKFLSRMSNTEYYKILLVLIKSILNALARIHESGIAHQNINDNCILISTFTNSNNIIVKLTDFGLGCGYNTDFNIIADCKINGIAPVKYTEQIIKELNETDYFKVSKAYDILCLGLLFLKYILHFDTELLQIINHILNNNNNKNENSHKNSDENVNIYYNKLKYLKKLILLKYLDKKLNIGDIFKEKDMSENKKKLLKQYIKFIWRYMLGSTFSRKPLQYILDKIIIYEKYKNDIF